MFYDFSNRITYDVKTTKRLEKGSVVYGHTHKVILINFLSII